MSTLDAALSYAARGWRVLALHHVAPDGTCSCGGTDCRPRAPKAGSIGKHPLLSDWQNGASTSESLIRDWWRRRPLANLGIATGPTSGLLVMDIDVHVNKKGELARGIASLAALEAELGPLPRTRSVRTGSGGQHRYFRHPPGSLIVCNSAGWRGADGIDWRSSGGQVVAPPSVAAAGAYTWIDEAEVAELPATWLAAHVEYEAQRGATKTKRTKARALPAGFLPPSAEHVAEDNRILEMAQDAANATKFKTLFHDGNWKSLGYRSQSEADLALCSLLAFWCDSNKEAPSADHIDRLFRRSALYRHKWERADYRGGTVTLAVKREEIRRASEAAIGPAVRTTAHTAAPAPPTAPTPERPTPPAPPAPEPPSPPPLGDPTFIIERAASKMIDSTKREKKIIALILRGTPAVRDGAQVVFVDGAGKPLADGKKQPYVRTDSTVYAAAELLAEILPEHPFASVADRMRPSLSETGNDGKDCMAIAEAAYRTAQQERQQQAERREQISKDIEEDKSGSKIMIAIMLERWKFIHAPDGEAFAVSGHVATPVRSKVFRLTISQVHFEKFRDAISDYLIRGIVDTLEAHAKFKGAERPVYLRVGGDETATYVDVGDENPARARAIEIKATGWRVIENAPVLFRRSAKSRPLPAPQIVPEQQILATLAELRTFLNLPSSEENDRAWILVLAFVIAAYRHTGPYPVLVLGGEQGSAKSTTSRMIRALIDPHVSPLRSEPKEPRDLAVGAENNWILAFDNLSHLPAWLSDAFCGLSTGRGFATRTLYENREEETFDSMRPIIINAIGAVATRGDLLDRALQVTLPPITKRGRKTEAKLWADFDAARPRILGALINAVAFGILKLPEVVLEESPRMADFAKFFCAAAPALGLTQAKVLEVLDANSDDATATALDASPVATALQKWIGEIGAKVNQQITASTLLHDLSFGNDAARGDVWPKGPNGLSNELRRLAPALRTIGIDVQIGRVGRRRWIKVSPCSVA